MTRSYIRPNRDWDMTDETMDSVMTVLDRCSKVEWVVLVSSIDRVNSESIKKVISLQNLDRVHVYLTKSELNSGMARMAVADRSLRYMGPRSYAINLDSDDEILLEPILRLVNSDLPSGMIGYGRLTDENSAHKEWNELNFDKVNRRGIGSTRDLQCFMSFIFDFYSLRCISKMNESKTQYFNPRSHSIHSEYPEDTHLACEISWMKRLDQFKSPRISIIADNLIKYNEHELQNSLRQDRKEKFEVHEDLKSVGYLYVDYKFLKISESSGRYVEFVPENNDITRY